MNKTKDKVKVSFKCPHCGESTTKDTCNYHKIIHGEYFKKNDVLDWDDIKSKVNDGTYQQFMLSDIYGWVKPFKCSSCNKGMRVDYHCDKRNIYGGDNSTHQYNLVKTGEYLDESFITKLFTIIERLNRGVPTGSTTNECEKQIFVKRLWKKIKHNFINKPFLVRDNAGNKIVMYITAVGYHLGWGEELDIYGVDLYGKYHNIRLDKWSMTKFDYLEFPEDLAKQMLTFICNM